MYSSFQLGIKFIRYWFSGQNGRGHGVHSPFVFEFITKVMNDDGQYYCYGSIETIRAGLLRNKTELELEDFGAGSRLHASYKRKVNEIASGSVKPKKFARLLFRMINFYQPSNVLELGTSLGITTAYLASANDKTPVTTLEGAGAIADLAQKNFKELGIQNITLVKGNFDTTLPAMLKDQQKIDFAYIDGNHRKEPTLRYFNMLMEKVRNNSILIFDDVHWSREMEEAWTEIKADPRISLTIDLFFIGIVFFRAEQKVKQDFIIRY